MDPRQLVSALAAIWPELPRLAGPRWSRLYPRLEQLVLRLQRAPDEEARRSEMADLVGLLRGLPAVRERWFQEMDRMGLEPWDPDRTERSVEAPLYGVAPTWNDALDGLGHRVASPVRRWRSDIVAPTHLAEGQRGAVVVDVLPHSAKTEREGGGFTASAHEPFLLHLSAPDGLEVEGDGRRSLDPDPDRRSGPAVFYLRGVRPGAHDLSLDIRQEDRLLSTIQFRLEVQDGDEAGSGSRDLVADLATGGVYAPPPDLEIRVKLGHRDHRSRLDYVLHSPTGIADFCYEAVEGVSLYAAPEAVHRMLLADITRIRRRKPSPHPPAGPDPRVEAIDRIGLKLHDDLFSNSMRRAWRKFWGAVSRIREKDADFVPTIQIISDEPWIPWEMLKTFDCENEQDPLELDHLCIESNLSRWLAGDSTPPRRHRPGSFACLDGGRGDPQKPLANTASECREVSRILTSIGGVDASPVPSARDEVLRSLERHPLGVLHFSGHGKVLHREPVRTAIRLHGGGILEPADLNRRRRLNLRRARTFVFLNACEVGDQGWDLTGLGGWARTLVQDCHAGAFVGPLWPVGDRLASLYARAFYEELAADAPLAAAARSARRHLREVAPGDPTWLAYGVYGHPNARLGELNAGGSAP